MSSERDCKICEVQGFTCKRLGLLGVTLGRRIIIPVEKKYTLIDAPCTIEECCVKNKINTPENFARELKETFDL